MRLGRLIFLAVVACSVVYPVRAYVVEPIYIATGSMEPTLPVGARCFVDKVTLRWREPRRGDIIIFHSPVEAGRDLGKRVIGLPGETVELKQKKVYVDGQALDEPYAVHKREGERLIGDDIGPIKVPADGLFVLGDNRDESEDSTVWKDADGQPLYFIQRNAVVGLVRGFYD